MKTTLAVLAGAIAGLAVAYVLAVRCETYPVFTPDHSRVVGQICLEPTTIIDRIAPPTADSHPR